MHRNFHLFRLWLQVARKHLMWLNFYFCQINTLKLTYGHLQSQIFYGCGSPGPPLYMERRKGKRGWGPITVSSIGPQILLSVSVNLVWDHSVASSLYVTRNSSGDELAYVNFLCDDIVHALQNIIDWCINSATDRRGYVLERRFTKFSEITQCNGHYTVQGHSRSPILVPIESSYTTSY